MIRFTADVLNGVPSIVIGITVYSLIVLRQKHFSAWSGGVALGIMMIPTVARATEEMLLMVPNVIREAGYGLGVPRWRVTLSITLRTASRRRDHRHACWPLLALRARPLRCCSPPSVISFGT